MRIRRQAMLILSLCCLGSQAVSAQDPTPQAGSAPSDAEASQHASSEPAAAEPAPAASSPDDNAATLGTAAEPDVDQLEKELASVLDELIQARTRTSVLVKTLFRTPIEVWVVRRADDQRLAHITLRLDGVPIHDSDGGALASGEAKLFSGFAAPGLHDLAIEISEQSKEHPDYRYVRAERFRLEVKRDTRTHIQLVLRDRSDMAERLPKGKTGEYDVRTVMRVRAEKVKD